MIDVKKDTKAYIKMPNDKMITVDVERVSIGSD